VADQLWFMTRIREEEDWEVSSTSQVIRLKSQVNSQVFTGKSQVSLKSLDSSQVAGHQWQVSKQTEVSSQVAGLHISRFSTSLLNRKWLEMPSELVTFQYQFWFILCLIPHRRLK